MKILKLTVAFEHTYEISNYICIRICAQSMGGKLENDGAGSQNNIDLSTVKPAKRILVSKQNLGLSAT